LNLACSDSEVLVEIGDETCKVKSLSETNLVCEPPKEQPSNPPGVSGSSALPLVKVNFIKFIELLQVIYLFSYLYFLFFTFISGAGCGSLRHRRRMHCIII